MNFVAQDTTGGPSVVAASAHADGRASAEGPVVSMDAEEKKKSMSMSMSTSMLRTAPLELMTDETATSRPAEQGKPVESAAAPLLLALENSSPSTTLGEEEEEEEETTPTGLHERSMLGQEASDVRLDGDTPAEVAAVAVVVNPSTTAVRNDDEEVVPTRPSPPPPPADAVGVGVAVAGVVEPAVLPVAAEKDGGSLVVGDELPVSASDVVAGSVSGKESPKREQVAPAAVGSSTAEGGEEDDAATEVEPTLPVATEGGGGPEGDETPLTPSIATGSGEELPERKDMAAVKSPMAGGGGEVAAPLAVDRLDATEPKTAVAAESGEMVGDEAVSPTRTVSAGSEEESFPRYEQAAAAAAVAVVEEGAVAGSSPSGAERGEETATPLPADDVRVAGVDRMRPVTAEDGGEGETPRTPGMTGSGGVESPKYEEVATVAADSSTADGGKAADTPPLATDDAGPTSSNDAVVVVDADITPTADGMGSVAVTGDFVDEEGPALEVSHRTAVHDLVDDAVILIERPQHIFS